MDRPPFDPADSAADPTVPDAGFALARLKPRLQERFAGRLDAERWRVAETRLDRHFPRLFERLLRLYGRQYDFFWHLEEIVATALDALAARSAPLQARDREAEASEAAGRPWFAGHEQIGAVAYVDRWAGTLADLPAKLPYLRDLGVTYLHLMPLLRAREGENDGGYAVASYREVEPRLGSMGELEALAGTLREAGIRLCVDFVFNHTADSHDWAERAKAGDPWYRTYYRMYPDRALPDTYQPYLREIFPDRGPGQSQENFLWNDRVGRYVWSTFYPYQWDLNFGNPALFRQMLAEMLFLANRGIEVLRLDAVPFLWKVPGTSSENLEEAHLLIQAYNAAARIAAPALTFKSEAIVHPDEVARYVGTGEAQLSYFPMFMVLLWEALATRDTRLMRHAVIKRYRLPPGTAWVSYLRCHDDIGWGFADEDAAELGIDGADHRRFLNAFYTGRFPGSFAEGLPFQENPRTGDCRISGQAASLVGLGRGGEEGRLALRRLAMLYGLVFTIGGLPLIYLGDELALTNDPSYLADPTKAHDNRWAHRPLFDWHAIERDLADPESPAAVTRAWFRALAGLRRREPALGGQDGEVVPLQNPHVFGLFRGHRGGRRLLVLANFTERDQALADPALPAVLGAGRWTCLLTGETYRWGAQGLVLAPYAFVVLPVPA
ncbi:MAG: alpha-amylase family glycosyl hydrolase [Azospirillaceae bacterium]